ncbi:glycosyltransferase [Brevundimonas mediterranea]
MIQYYITYGARRERISPIELALFTHLEDDPATAERFQRCAEEVEGVVAMSRATAEILERMAIRDISTINPGVDLDLFEPKIKVAVVGRTYHTGRKGEALVNAVMQTPGVEWHFTGEGWPGPSRFIPSPQLPDFYRSMDYILVPATTEGGPMSVLEALASGVEVIASDVGWVPDFPHIPFEKNNPDSLRATLEELVAKKWSLRKSVEHMTWSNWAAQHDELFNRLAADARDSNTVSWSSVSRKVKSALLLTHGAEDKTLGGPSVRVPRTAASLEELGISGTARSSTDDLKAECFDVLHVFNGWHPSTARRAISWGNRNALPVVFSPIFLNLSEAKLWQEDLLIAFRKANTLDDALRAFIAAKRIFRRNGLSTALSQPEPGFEDVLRELADSASALIFLSEYEKNAFEGLTGGERPSSFIVRNPVDVDRFSSGDPKLFKEAYGLSDYVLCVARIEHRKNQLMLAAALSGTDISLVLVGHSVDEEYLALLKRYGGANLKIINRFEPASDMLVSAYAGARVFALPSWCEGGPLAALEAASAGCAMVLSDRSGEREYFGDMASYCDPSDIDSIREAILRAWDEPRSDGTRRELIDHMRAHHSWARYASETAEAYEAAVQGQDFDDKSNVGPLPDLARTRRVVFDLTTFANNAQLQSGIVRVERAIAGQLAERDDREVMFVVWHSVQTGFVEVPWEIISSNTLRRYMAHLTTHPDEIPTITKMTGGDYIVVGSSWMQNASYAASIRPFAKRYDLTVSVMMHDMTPVLFPEWYPERYSGPWAQNCAAMIETADRLIVYSENTRRDISEFAHRRDMVAPPFAMVRLADEIGQFPDGDAVSSSPTVLKFAKLPFIIVVGGIHPRKNYGLLFDVWRTLKKDMRSECPHLVIVGGVSWGGKDQARALTENPDVRDRVHILSHIGDVDLAWLYQHCLFTVYPSLYEGWGLPIGESLARGKICLASSTSSMVEIAPALTDLLDPQDRQAWVARIKHYALSNTTRRAREAQISQRYVLTPWSVTTDQVLEALEAPMRPVRGPHYNTGTFIIAGEDDAAKYLADGWHKNEPWGVWAREREAKLEFFLAHSPEEDLVLSVIAKVFRRPETSIQYDVMLGATRLAVWEYPGMKTSHNMFEFSVGHAVIPRALLGDDRRVQITLRTTSLSAVNTVVPSDDTRTLGLGMAAFSLTEKSKTLDVVKFASTRPNFREAIGVDGTRDLAHLMSDVSMRRALTFDRWMKPRPDNWSWIFEKGVSVGPSMVSSRNGYLEIAGGLSRLKFSSPLRLSLLISGKIPSVGFKVSLMVNGEMVGVMALPESEVLEASFDVDPGLFARVDPVRIVLLSADAEIQGGDLEFIVSGLKLATSSELPPMPPLEISSALTLVGHSPTAVGIFLDGGWYQQELDGLWSMASTGRIIIDVGGFDDASYVLVKLRLSRLSSGEKTDAVSITFGGKIKAHVEFPHTERGHLSEAETLSLVLSASDLEGLDFAVLGISLNNFEISDLHSRPDERRLGVYLSGLAVEEIERSLAVEEAPLLSLETSCAVGAVGEESVLWGDGWHDPEPSGRWMSAKKSSLTVNVPVIPNDRSFLAFTFRKLTGGTVEDTPTVLINRKLASVLRIDRTDTYILLAETRAQKGGFLDVALKVKRVFVPNAVGLSTDTRELGAHLTRISQVEVSQDWSSLVLADTLLAD